MALNINHIPPGAGATLVPEEEEKEELEEYEPEPEVGPELDAPGISRTFRRLKPEKCKLIFLRLLLTLRRVI